LYVVFVRVAGKNRIQKEGQVPMLPFVLSLPKGRQKGVL
jgi:hypothetical protein